MRIHAWVPILIGIASGGVVAVAMIFFAPSWLAPMVRVVACYNAAVIAMLAWYWGTVLTTQNRQPRALAASDDPGRDVAFVLTLMAVGFGFVAAFAILGRGPHDRIPPHEAFVDVVGFGAVILGWVLINTIFTFRYAHLYYRDHDRDKQSDRGLAFPGNEDPDYLDFAYFAFVVGMTFQVSDVQVTSRVIRRFVLLHGFISFCYNTAILALVVNVVSGLLR